MQILHCLKPDGREMLTARLHPIKPKGGEVYSVVFRGERIVERSRHAACDTARALLAKGVTGKLAMLDGKTGKPRMIIDIERAARLTVEEGPNGPRFVKCRQTVVDRAYASETKIA